MRLESVVLLISQKFGATKICLERFFICVLSAIWYILPHPVETEEKGIPTKVVVGVTASV